MRSLKVPSGNDLVGVPACRWCGAGSGRALVHGPADLMRAVLGRLRYLQRTPEMFRSFFQHPQSRYAACALISERTTRDAMRVRVLLCALGTVALFIPFRANASVVSICNQGDTSLNVTTAVYTKSLW
ncbi:MAG: hypothetical protein ACREBW_07315, partial [Candidatus Micrarchaeaceae archaeon]